MENTPKFSSAQPPLLPRAILDGALLPFFISEPLSPLEVAVERLAYAAEVEAARPSHIIALTAALRALGSLS